MRAAASQRPLHFIVRPLSPTPLISPCGASIRSPTRPISHSAAATRPSPRAAPALHRTHWTSSTPQRRPSSPILSPHFHTATSLSSSHPAHPSHPLASRSSAVAGDSGHCFPQAPPTPCPPRPPPQSTSLSLLLLAIGADQLPIHRVQLIGALSISSLCPPPPPPSSSSSCCPAPPARSC